MGFPISDEKLTLMNEYRRNRTDGGDITQLDISSGGRYPEYGKNRDGYWVQVDIAKEVNDVLLSCMRRFDQIAKSSWKWTGAAGTRRQRRKLSVRKLNIAIGLECKGGAFIPKTIGCGIADGGVILGLGCFNPDGELLNSCPGGRQYFAFKCGDVVVWNEADRSTPMRARASMSRKGLCSWCGSRVSPSLATTECRRSMIPSTTTFFLLQASALASCRFRASSLTRTVNSPFVASCEKL